MASCGRLRAWQYLQPEIWNRLPRLRNQFDSLARSAPAGLAGKAVAHRSPLTSASPHVHVPHPCDRVRAVTGWYRPGSPSMPAIPYWPSGRNQHITGVNRFFSPFFSILLSVIAMAGITGNAHRAAVLAKPGDPKGTVAGICPNRFRGCLRKPVPAVCPFRPCGTVLVASSPSRSVAPRCRFGSATHNRRAYKDLRNVTDTGKGDGERCCQDNGRLNLGRGRFGSTRWIRPAVDKGVRIGFSRRLTAGPVIPPHAG